MIAQAGALLAAATLLPVAPRGPIGAEIFAQRCAACHSVETGKPPKIGPELRCIGARMAGTQPGYLYSDAMRRSRLRWSTVELDRFLSAPSTALPGTRMFFAGIKDSEQRRALINFMQTCPKGK